MVLKMLNVKSWAKIMYLIIIRRNMESTLKHLGKKRTRAKKKSNLSEKSIAQI